MSAAYSKGALAASDRARGEALMNLLLDRGASARDSVPYSTGINVTGGAHPAPQAESTVLSLAITGSSHGIVKRLLEDGADARERLKLYSDGPGFWDDGVDVWGITALQLGSRCWNVDGVRYGPAPSALGRSGRRSSTRRQRPENSLKDVLTRTFELIVPEDNRATTANFINIPDKKGATPLHYAVSAHAHCGTRGSDHAYHAAEWLYSHGADAGIIDCTGQTVLHRVARSSLRREPLDLRLIDLLLDHGAPLDHADENGETALHIMARNLRQAAATRVLIQRGARVDLVNNKGNTPLHEAMRGALRPRLSWDGAMQKGVIMEDRIRAQDEVVQTLMEIDRSIMEWRNREGKSPRELREETRQRWVELETHRHC
ncbi:ankyrin repeat-containing domain protein [Aspergillus pseudodeflectus]|uniref:Ankyrin repeat-containing domain protein n=1 Tax=Aspergillus pseudodeflectus TaxID=176178 RepID=A0ABR4K497_9EURO